MLLLLPPKVKFARGSAHLVTFRFSRGFALVGQAWCRAYLITCLSEDTLLLSSIRVPGKTVSAQRPSRHTFLVSTLLF